MVGSRWALRRPARVAVLVLSWSATACVRYVPVSDARRGAATSVRVLLNERGRAENATRLAGVARSVEGTVVRWTDDSVVVQASTVKYYDQADLPMGGNEVALSRSHVSSVAEPQTDRKKTTLAIAVFTAAAVLVTAVVQPGWFGSGRTQVTAPPR
jgi:hypothetical protein